MAPQKEGVVLPDDNKVIDLIAGAEKSEIKPYQDKITGDQLMEEKPQKGRILLTRKNEALGVVEMTLSNGAKVILKPTDFKNDEVLFRAFSPGGYSVYSTADHQSALNASDIIGQSGLAGFSPNDISKLLAGKTVSLTPYISPYFEGLSGMAAPRDLESMFQLTYLTFTQPRKDSALFASFIAKQKGVITNLLSDPENYFSDQFQRIKTQNHPRAEVIPTEADIDKINFDRVFEIYNDRFADASGFVFILVGSFKTDSIKPFIETYLASLPSLKKEESWMDLGIRPPAKKTDKAVYKGKDPKSIVAIYSERDRTWDPEKSHVFASLGQLLDIRYVDVLREEMSGIYGMGVRISLVRIPYQHLETSIYIPCSPENADKLTKAALDEIRKIQKEGVNPEDLNKVKEGQRRDLEKNLRENSYWAGQLMDVYRHGDPGIVTRVGERINALSSEQLREAAREVNLDTYVRVILYPEKD
jgi:zinc protease